MSLKKLEKVGMVAGYIPLVSTVTGIIMSIVYYNKAKSSKEPSQEIAEGAKKAHNLGTSQLNVDQETTKCYVSLWKASIVETIPLVNIVAAIYSTTVLNKLSKLREVNDSEINKEQFLIEKYKIRGLGLVVDERVIRALLVLDSLHSDLPEFSEDFQQTKKKKLAIFIAGMFQETRNIPGDKAVSFALAHMQNPVDETLESMPLNEAWEIFLARQIEAEENQKKREEDYAENLRKLRSPTNKEIEAIEQKGLENSKNEF